MKFWKYILCALAPVGTVVSAQAATDISTCQAITLRGSYRLTQNLETTGITCITIVSSNCPANLQNNISTLQQNAAGVDLRFVNHGCLDVNNLAPKKKVGF